MPTKKPFYPIHPCLISTSMGVLLFFLCVYPFIHNSILFVLNLVPMLTLGARVPIWANLVLLGTKDALLLLSLTLLALNSRPWAVALLTLSVVACLFHTGIMAVKTLAEPALTLLILILYRAELVGLYACHKSKVYKALSIIAPFMLITGGSELLLRKIWDLRQDANATYAPLVANNNYRCARPSHLRDKVAFTECLESRMNYYKLLHKNNEYYFLHALTFPVGDSTLLSILLFYLLILLYLGNLDRFTWPWATGALFLSFSIFLTLNRIHSIAVLALIIGHLWGACRQPQYRTKYALIGLGTLLLFWFNRDYLLWSLFDPETPSNIGHGINVDEAQMSPKDLPFSHIAILKGIISNRHWLALIPSLIFLYLKKWRLGLSYGVFFLIFYYNISQLKMGLNANYVFQNLESDFLKSMFTFDIGGIITYSLILSYILAQSIKHLQASAVNRHKFPVAARHLLLFALGMEFIIYQFIAPYFISGFAVYFSFLGVWFFNSQLLFSTSTSS